MGKSSYLLTLAGILLVVLVLGSCVTPAITPDTPQSDQILTEPKKPSPCPCPRGNPLPQITYYPFPSRPWNRIPNVTISAVENDHRIQLVKEAVEFWNQQLAELGSPFHLGTITHTSVRMPDDYLIRGGAAVEKQSTRPTPPDTLKSIPGDIIIALSNAMFVSWTQYPRTGKVVIAIRNLDTPPLNVVNVPQNLIAHELGHAIGLGHNNDKTKLMCGRPADCRPLDFNCDCEKYFPITAEEKEKLKNLYPSGWKPAQ